MLKKLLIVSSISAAVAALTGCGADVGSDNGGNVTGGGSSSNDKSFVSCNDATSTCTLSGVINEDYTLDTSKKWRLQGFTLVGEGNVVIADKAQENAIKAAGVTLTIPAGVEVKASIDGVLVVTRGSKLEAVGTSSQPITFSSDKDSDLDGSGEWGGVIIQGFAPQFGFNNIGTCVSNGVCNVTGEGGTLVGKFGGDDAADNSGTLKYVRIAEAGIVAGPNNEINGLTLQGVGHGTVIDYIQVHGSQDDGIEWFGGTVNVTHAVLTNNDDDDIDYDEGYKGNIQFAFVRKDPSTSRTGPFGTNDPRGIEANSKVSDNKAVPQTNAALSNITILGSIVNNCTAFTGNPAVCNNVGQPGILLRGLVNTALYKVAVSNFTTSKGCVEAKQSEAGTVSAFDFLCDGSVMFQATTAVASDASQKNINPTKMQFDSAGAITNTEAALASASAPTAVGSGFTFESTDYIGAVDPDGTNSVRKWWDGWTVAGSLANLPN
jgi:hypothetical protein